MENFEIRTIVESSQIIAKELKKARESKRLSLFEVSKQLKINYKYLEALERGDFDALPTGVYKINFLREYVLFLGLPMDEFKDLFEDSVSGDRSIPKDDLFVKKARNVHFSLTIPKLFRSLLIFSASAVCVLYLIFSLNEIMSPPELSIESPSLDIVTTEKEIVVKGTTVPEAEITINDVLVLADSFGAFEKTVNLKSGLNTIVITAQKKYSRSSELVKKIFVSDS